LRELRTDALVVVIGDSLCRDLREHFGPCQRCTLTRVEQRRLAPCGEMEDAQRTFAVDRGLLDMHVQAEGAAVDLRCADLYQVLDRLLDGCLLELRVELDELLGQCRGLLHEIGALAHVDAPGNGGKLGTTRTFARPGPTLDGASIPR